MRVLGPRPNRQLEPVVLHVDEAGVAEVALELGPRLGVAAALVAGFEEGVDPDERLMVLGQGAVLGVVLQVEVLQLGPA